MHSSKSDSAGKQVRRTDENATNTVKNDDLDELTAMLQSLDEPTAQAAKASGSDEIDDLLAGLNDDIGKPVEAVAEEVIKPMPLMI